MFFAFIFPETILLEETQQWLPQWDISQFRSFLARNTIIGMESISVGQNIVPYSKIIVWIAIEFCTHIEAPRWWKLAICVVPSLFILCHQQVKVFTQTKKISKYKTDIRGYQSDFHSSTTLWFWVKYLNWLCDVLLFRHPLIFHVQQSSRHQIVANDLIMSKYPVWAFLSHLHSQALILNNY